ncbi:hypothetical protein IT412_01145 [Candidatus Peregrinibacteria bacterium]|nr:hypothetical protein [Candidatus Peregrinibacteria bacterium]
MESILNFYKAFVNGRLIDHVLMAEFLLWTTGIGLVLLATVVKLTWVNRQQKAQFKLMDKLCRQNEEQFRIWRKLVGDVDKKTEGLAEKARDKKPRMRLVSNDDEEGLPKKESEEKTKGQDQEFENLFKHGEKIMKKLKKDKGLVREVGLLNTFVVLGLGYMLMRVVSSVWERIKYRFEDEQENPDQDDEDLEKQRLWRMEFQSTVGVLPRRFSHFLK